MIDCQAEQGGGRNEGFCDGAISFWGMIHYYYEAYKRKEPEREEVPGGRTLRAKGALDPNERSTLATFLLKISGLAPPSAGGWGRSLPC